MSDGATPPCVVSPVTPSRSRIVRSYCSLVRRVTCEVTATPAVQGVVATPVPPVPAVPVRMTPVPAGPPVPLVTAVPAAPVVTFAPAAPLADPVVLPAPAPGFEEDDPPTCPTQPTTNIAATASFRHFMALTFSVRGRTSSVGGPYARGSSSREGFKPSQGSGFGFLLTAPTTIPTPTSFDHFATEATTGRIHTCSSASNGFGVAQPLIKVWLRNKPGSLESARDGGYLFPSGFCDVLHPRDEGRRADWEMTRQRVTGSFAQHQSLEHGVSQEL